VVILSPDEVPSEGGAYAGMGLPTASLKSHPELVSVLMAPSMSTEALKKHVVMLRTESVQRVARPILSRLMGHSLNKGVFNEPVNPVALNIPDYNRIVEHPMDFGTIKERLQALQYEQLEPFIADVRLVMHNAKIYNPSTNRVHQAAKQMSEEFEDELAKLSRRILRDNKRRTEHSCDLCQGQECGLCGEKCLRLEPVMLTCSGACNQRLKRGGNYYISADGARLWCQKCYTGLSSVLPPFLSGDPDVDLDASASLVPQYKRDLLKRTFEEDIPEPWVQCDHCSVWYHQACVLFNPLTAAAPQGGAGRTTRGGGGAASSTPAFKCPLCRLGPEAKDLPSPWLHRSRDTFFGQSDLPALCEDPSPPPACPPLLPGKAAGGDSPLNSHLSFSGESLAGYTTKESCDGSGSDTDASEVLDSKASHVGESGPAAPREHLPVDAASLPQTHMSRFIEDKVRGRLLDLGHPDAADSTCIRVVSSVDREWAIPTPVRKHFRGVPDTTIPETLGFRSKAIMMFQTIEGTDICLFCMYVQEYNADAPAPNAGHVYISYLDSVEYFRPRSARTNVYHEIIVAYLAWVRARGFTKAHLWACPPQRGNNFIFWCHPQHQRTPSKDRLLSWYRSMLEVAQDHGVVTKVADFFNEYYAPLLEGRRSSPPLFEGDYWIEETCRLYTLRQRRRVTVGDDASAYEMCEALIRSLRLHPSANAFNQPVDPKALKIPDYFAVIKRPMDLGSVSSQLREGCYATVRDMLDDILLVFKNASTYNPPKHPVHVAAGTLRVFFDREWAALQSRWHGRPGHRGAPELADASLIDDEELQVSDLDDPGRQDGEQPPKEEHGATASATPAGGHAPANRPSLARAWSSSSDSLSDGDADEVLLLGGGDSVDEDEKWQPPKLPAKATGSSRSRSGGARSRRGGRHGAASSSPELLVSYAGTPACGVHPRLQSDWLLRDVGRSVLKLKHDLLVLHLASDAAPEASRQDKNARYHSYVEGKVTDAAAAALIAARSGEPTDPDPFDIVRPLVDGRHTLLEVSMFRRLQFDSLRRAKYATAVLLNHLHFPQCKLSTPCSMCGAGLAGLRWHCGVCTDYDVCSDCSTAAGVQCSRRHALTPYHITSFE